MLRLLSYNLLRIYYVKVVYTPYLIISNILYIALCLILVLVHRILINISCLFLKY